MKDRVDRDINVGDFVVYVTMSESPGLEFGRVMDYYQTKSGTKKIKIHKCEADGTGLTVQAIDIAGHWRADTPKEVRTSRLNGKYYSRSMEEFNKYYVDATYLDTGKPQTTTLDAAGSYRIMVTQPI